MPTLTTTPAYAPPGRNIEVHWTLAESGADFLRVWLVDAPAGSRLKAQLAEGVASRLVVFTSEEGLTWSTGDFDVGGNYVFVTQEYTRGASAHGGDYEGDPNAAPSETKLGAETTVTLNIGQRMTQRLGFGRDTATLVLYVWGDTIRETRLSEHGEVSPAIVRPSTPRATTAATDTNVLTAVAALKGVAADTAIGSLGTIIGDIVSKFNAHRTEATIHQTDDDDNVIPVVYSATPTPQNFPQIVSTILRFLDQHMRNDAGGVDGDAGTNSAVYHDVGGAKVDWTNLPLFKNAGTVEECYAALADIWRAYTAHAASTSVHDAADAGNVLTNINGTILNVHRYFLDSLAKSSPTVPQTRPSAAVKLATKAGFSEG